MVALHGAVRPRLGVVRHRNSFAVLLRLFETVRLRVAHSLLRLFAPVARAARVPTAPLLPLQHHLAAVVSTPLGRRRTSIRRLHQIALATTEQSILQHLLPLRDGNVVPYSGRRPLVESFDPQDLLERLCIAVENFHFETIQRVIAVNGDVLLMAEIDGERVRDSAGLCLDEVGRQMGQLGLVAVGACNAERRDAFYVAKSVSMEEFPTRAPLKARTFTGLARVVQLQAHDARVELELWHRESVVCRMSAEYDVFSSWQEVLPSLASSSTC